LGEFNLRLSLNTTLNSRRGQLKLQNPTKHNYEFNLQLTITHTYSEGIGWQKLRHSWGVWNCKKWSFSTLLRCIYSL